MHRSQKRSEIRAIIERFEETLKEKVAHKGTAHQGEEVVLHKAFKYFDLNDNGTVDIHEFMKALEKVGVWIDNPKQADIIFNYYDVDANGGLDYYEFIGKVYRLPSKVPKCKMNMSGIAFRSRQSTTGQVERALDKVRRKFQSRGSTVLDVARQFKIIDDSNDSLIQYQEFRKAMVDFKVGLSEEEMKMVFQYFDSDRQGAIDYDEFMAGLKGRMSLFRQQIVDRVFDRLDRNGNGVVDIDDIQDQYVVDKHPEYMQGKKSKQQVLGEFLKNFEKYSDLQNIRDGKVSKQEFRDYYSFISSSIDSDQYFESMMVRCWRLDDPDYQQNRKSQIKGDTAKNLISDSKYVRFVQQELKDQTRPMSSEIGKQQLLKMKEYQQQCQQYQKQQDQKRYQQQQSQSQFQQGKMKGSHYKQRQDQQKYQQQQIEMRNQSGGQLIQQLRKKFRLRGTMSTFALARSFKSADENGSHDLSLAEFSKCMNEFRLGFDEREIIKLFRMFDSDKSGVISYDEFLRGVVGEMNSFRKNVVKTAYKKLERDSRGYVSLSDIKEIYNAKRHPAVVERKRTEEQVLMEFLETFECHYQNIKNDGRKRNSQISVDEFIDYYNNISISIDSDTYFEMMVRNAWNVDTDRIYPKVWKKDYY